MRTLKVISAIFCIITFPNLNAQVTIGQGVKPEKAALLDIKTIDIPENGSQGGITTDKDGGGLLLPRVELSDKEQMLPFIGKETEGYDDLAERHKRTLFKYKKAVTENKVVG